mgnify:CR=1
MDEVRKFNPKLASYIIKHPLEAIKMFEDQLNSQLKSMHDDMGNSKVNNEKM